MEPPVVLAAGKEADGDGDDQGQEEGDAGEPHVGQLVDREMSEPERPEMINIALIPPLS